MKFKFFSPVPKSPIRTGLISVKKPLLRISCLGPFKRFLLESCEFYIYKFLLYPQHNIKFSTMDTNEYALRSLYKRVLKVTKKNNFHFLSLG